MRKIMYQCDRCKQEIQGNPYKFFAEELERESEDLAYKDPYPEMKEKDFCRACTEHFISLINRHCEKGVPAVLNQDFEQAVQEMIATSQPEDAPTDPPRRKKRPGERLMQEKSVHSGTQDGQ